MSKYRLVRDNYASTKEDWYLVQKWEMDRWALISCGTEVAMRKVYSSMTRNPGMEQYTVVEQTDTVINHHPECERNKGSDRCTCSRGIEALEKDRFKAREAKADLGL